MITIALSIICGVYGRCNISMDYPRKSFNVSCFVVGVKSLALLVFLYFFLWLSFSFTFFMTIVWAHRARNFKRAWKSSENNDNSLLEPINAKQQQHNDDQVI